MTSQAQRKTDDAAHRSYKTSEEMLERALKVIPLGSQTFSKSYTQYPRGAAPFFIDRAEGSKAYDVDGNEYIDFVSALASVTLGHCDVDVTKAVEAQIKKGTIFTLASELEIEVAEKLVELVPCAEQVRFGKNGSDVTSGAIRAARAFTGRDRVAVCGYHGWQDWYIGSTLRNKGVPQSTRDLTSNFTYNDLSSLEKVLDEHKDEFAAVILEPMNVDYPKEGFLQGVIDLAHKHGALVIFDETITGFRLSLGGAQELFNVKPDLATFGKGLANGYPLSAVVGRKDVMREFEDVFFSFTMGGETLSLAAAKATLNKLQQTKALDKIAAQGSKLIEATKALIEKHGCGEFMETKGHPSWTFLVIKDANDVSMWDIKTLWVQEVLARGILSLGSHNLSYAHTDADIEKLLSVYDEVFPLLRDAVKDRRISQYLRCEPLRPLFRVR